MIVAPHPLLPAPRLAEIDAEARRVGCSPAEALARLLKMRNEIIALETEDPLRYGWEPDIWKICDALLGFGWCDTGFARRLQARLGMDWQTFAKAIRERLGFAKPVNMLLAMGGNRTGKSEYAAKRGQLMLTEKEKSRVIAFHMSNPRSVMDQQPLFWKYMPPEYRHQVAGVDEYVKYRRKTGFADNSFINAKGSECMFGNYSQDLHTAVEGLEVDLVLPDELVGIDWLETLVYRLATRSGRGIVTFTPLEGYTPSVKFFCDGARVTRWNAGFLLDKDGGGPAMHAALGLTPAEMEELERDQANAMAPKVPLCRSEDCIAWLESPKPQTPMMLGDLGVEVVDGRAWERVPRVLRCVNENFAVVYFHSSDNPYGNPKRVMTDALAKKSRDEVRVRVFGIANKTARSVFAKFRPSVHVIDQENIPAGGANFMFMDPAGDRNFFLTWIRNSQEHDYGYREWPGTYEVPGVGVPGPWAEASGKKNGINDGRRGEAQSSWGWGLLRYKFEIARLEGWEDYQKWLQDAGGEMAARAVMEGTLFPDNDEIIDWDEENGAREIISERFVDSRAASNPRMEKDRPVTLLEDLRDIGIHFELTPGSSTTDGLNAINTALDYNAKEDGSFFNKPRLLLGSALANTIYAFQNYMNVDGEKGAMKDPIDNWRYYYTLDESIRLWTPDAPRSVQGFHYGRPLSKTF